MSDLGPEVEATDLIGMTDDELHALYVDFDPQGRNAEIVRTEMLRRGFFNR